MERGSDEWRYGIGGCAGGRCDDAETSAGGDRFAFRLWPSAGRLGADVGGEWDARSALAPHGGVASGAEAKRGFVDGCRSLEVDSLRLWSGVAGGSRGVGLGAGRSGKTRGGGGPDVARVARGDGRASGGLAPRDGVVRSRSGLLPSCGARCDALADLL